MPAWSAGVQSGTRGAQPTPASDAAGVLYFVSDEDVLERWSGSAWVQVAINALDPYPPGHEFDYVQITSPVSVTGTSEGGATTVITGGSVSYDGSTDIMVEFYSPDLQNNGSAFCILHLWDGASVLGRLGIYAGSNGQRWPGGIMSRRLTPSAGSHQYIIKGQVDASSSTVGAGAGGSAAYMPAFIRVTKAA
jgi:hypothetical protein